MDSFTQNVVEQMILKNDEMKQPNKPEKPSLTELEEEQKSNPFKRKTELRSEFVEDQGDLLIESSINESKLHRKIQELEVRMEKSREQKSDPIQESILFVDNEDWEPVKNISILEFDCLDSQSYIESYGSKSLQQLYSLSWWVTKESGLDFTSK